MLVHLSFLFFSFPYVCLFCYKKKKKKIRYLYSCFINSSIFICKWFLQFLFCCFFFFLFLNFLFRTYLSLYFHSLSLSLSLSLSQSISIYLSITHTHTHTSPFISFLFLLRASCLSSIFPDFAFTSSFCINIFCSLYFLWRCSG